MASPTSSNRRGRLWVVSETYFPELTGTGYFLTGIAEGLAATFDVAALCSQPTYAARGARAPRREALNGVEVHRVIGTTFNKDWLALRLVNMSTISIATFTELAWRLRRGDVAFVVTNPPSMPFIARLASWCRGARCVLLVHDVYPDALVAAGLLAPRSATVRLMAAIERRLLRSVDAICVVGRDMAALLRDRAPGVPITVIPNWAGDDVVESDEQSPNPFRESLNLAGRFVVQHAGNIGRVQDVETMVEAAVILQRRAPRVHFLFIGSGRRRAWLEEAIARRGLTNVTMARERRRGDQAVFLRACDLAVMAFVPGMYGLGVPSRLYNIMASGRAVVAAVDATSEPGLVIAEERVGWVVPPARADILAETIAGASESPETLRAMAARAREAARVRYRQADAVARHAALLTPFGLRVRPPGPDVTTGSLRGERP